jgi:hypothetical protein
MCDTVLVKNVVCETQQELADTLGVDLAELVQRGTLAQHPDICLCQIDVEKTATKHGYTAEVYYDAVADWKLVPN